MTGAEEDFFSYRTILHDYDTNASEKKPRRTRTIVMTDASHSYTMPSTPGILSRFQYWKMILVLGGINFIDAMVYSIPAPFYPQEAESKGLSKTEYGLVFGSFELTSFIACPLIANFIHKHNPRTVYYVGVLIVGTSVSLFGFLDRINLHVGFLMLSFLLRIVESIGSALLFVSSYTIVTNRSPGSVATTFATMEVLFGMGFSMGPIVGEALYVLGGFQLPFFTLGGTLFAVGILAYLFVDAYTDDDNLGLARSASQHKMGIMELLAVPVIALQAIGIIVGAMSISFLYAVLEPHLRQFGLPPMTTGLIFFVNGATYAVFSPIMGKLCDRISQDQQSQVTGIGFVLVFIAFVLIGPAPFLPIAPHVELVVAGLILIGFGLPAIYVSSFMKALAVGKDEGFLDPNALVSGMWMGCMSLGSFIGPSAAGILSDNFGFRNATYLIMLMNLALIGLTIAYIVNQRRKRRPRFTLAPDERTGLLISSSTSASISSREQEP